MGEHETDLMALPGVAIDGGAKNINEEQPQEEGEVAAAVDEMLSRFGIVNRFVIGGGGQNRGQHENENNGQLEGGSELEGASKKLHHRWTPPDKDFPLFSGAETC